MTPTVRIAQFGEYMSRHCVDVFDAMLCLPVGLSEKPAPRFSARVCGLVCFAGESVTGAVGIHFSETFARRATAAMLGLTPDDITSQAGVNDAVGEIAKMLTGGLKAWLHDGGISCVMSAPVIIRGSAFNLEPMPEMERETLVFECGHESVVLEINVKQV